MRECRKFLTTYTLISLKHISEMKKYGTKYILNVVMTNSVDTYS